jgi:hypothetical protein
MRYEYLKIYMKSEIQNRNYSNPNEIARRTRTCTRISHHLNCHVGPAVSLGPLVIHQREGHRGEQPPSSSRQQNRGRRALAGHPGSAVRQGGVSGEGDRAAPRRGPTRTHRCTRHGLACPKEAGPRAPAVSSSAAAAVRAPAVGTAEGVVLRARSHMAKVMTAAARHKEKRSSEDGGGSELSMAIHGVRTLWPREERGRRAGGTREAEGELGHGAGALAST